MAHWWNTIVIAIYLYNAKKMICTMMFITWNHVIKGVTNLRPLVSAFLQCKELLLQ